jgi:hypothetical protein
LSGSPGATDQHLGGVVEGCCGRSFPARAKRLWRSELVRSCGRPPSTLPDFLRISTDRLPQDVESTPQSETGSKPERVGNAAAGGGRGEGIVFLDHAAFVVATLDERALSRCSRCTTRRA